ncbi:retrotransposon protein, putative, ty1-copia subclass [Tanacetum coccineum]
MFEGENLSGSNYNDWFRSPKMVLRVEKKLFVIEQPIFPALPADSKYLHSGMRFMMLIIRLLVLRSKEEGKPVGPYVIKMKNYVAQLERHGYVLPQDLSVGLIMNGLTSDFVGFVRNYNKHNMGKIIGELHALLIEYEKGLPKKAATPQVMAIQGGRIQKANKKSFNAKGKGKGKEKGKDKSYIPKPKNHKPSTKEYSTKNDAYHHYKEVGHCKRNCPAYLAELIKKKKQVGTDSSSDIFVIEFFFLLNPGCMTLVVVLIFVTPKHGLRGVRKLKQVEAIRSFDLDYGISVSKNDVFYFNVIPSNGIYEIDMSNLVPNVNSIYNVSNKRVNHNLNSTYLWHYRLAHVNKKRIEKLQHDGLLKSMDYESFDQCVSCLSGKMRRKSFPHRLERATDLLGLIHTDVCGLLRHASRQGASYFITFTDDYSRYGYIYLLKHKHEDYALESVARIINMVPTKKVDKHHMNYGYLKETVGYYLYFPPENKIVVARYITFWNTSKIPMEVECFEPPHEKEAPVRRSVRTHRAPERLCLNVEVEEHILGDLNEPTNYKAAMLDPESNKWRLVDLPPDCKTVGSKWLFKKKTDMDGNVHTYKARLVAKGFTQLYGVDYEETFSPVADIRAIRILIAIATFYDYEIWQMDVKTAFLNGYLDEDIYMVQPEGFVDPKHPTKVCKLQRSIYGLKQASRSWNKRFDEEIKKFRFTQNLDEPCVYQKASGSNVTFLILYVNEIIIIGNHIPSLQSVKTYLGKCFAMKDLGEATFILRIKIYRDRSKRLIGLSQSTYMDKILRRFKMDTSKRGYIPMQERLDLNKTQGASTPREVKRVQNVPYASAVGSIINTKDMFLVYGGNPEAKLRVDCYCNAGFETDRDEIKSQTGYVFILNGRRRLGIVPTINEPIKMFYDNSAALLIANEPGVQRGAKHYHRRYLLKVHTDDNLADPFTKALPKGKLTQHARSMGLRLASGFM